MFELTIFVLGIVTGAVIGVVTVVKVANYAIRRRR